MTISTPSSRLVLVLIASAALASTVACGSNGGDSAPIMPDPSGPSRTPDAADAGDGDGGTKAPPVEGPATTSDLTDKLGIFVTTTGDDAAAGTHDQPLATIQAGIDKAKTVGKRVYVCAGTFKESLTIADSISVIGGLDCSQGQWSTGGGRSRVEAPSSPAVRAKDITIATRIEGLDVIAPNATVSSGSSIALLADHASALTVARAQLVAGDAMKGDDGLDAVQLVSSPTTAGGGGSAQLFCNPNVASCDRSIITNDWSVPRGGAGGTNACEGAAGHAAQSGGAGGSGGLIQFMIVEVNGVPFPGQSVYKKNNAFARSDTPDVRTGAAGDGGIDGHNGDGIVATAEGFVPADGVRGADGAPGFGGAGGDGVRVDPALPYVEGQVWRGTSAAGGGAGGCPGLAGSAGKGGGASIAVLMLESGVTFNDAVLSSGHGGAGGIGTFGSKPTAGGAAGTQPGAAVLAGMPGGHGGAAGISGNGANGPSVGVAYVGSAPTITGTTKITPGAAASAIDGRSRVDALTGVTKTIPPTPAGMSKDILAL